MARAPWGVTVDGGMRGMVIADNRFDSGYNPGGIAEQAPVAWSGTSINDCRFTNNTYVLGAGDDLPWRIQATLAGSGNTFTGEHWTKPAGRMADCVLPFTGSTYADCDFHLPVPVSFPASASGTDNVFDHGSTGGTFD